MNMGERPLPPEEAVVDPVNGAQMGGQSHESPLIPDIMRLQWLDSPGQHRQPLHRLRKFGRAAAAVVTMLGCAMAVDIVSSKIRYPDTETSVTVVEGDRDVPLDQAKKVTIVFGGLGRVNAKAPAEELSEAKDRAGLTDEAVAYVTYPNQGFGDKDHKVLEEFINKNHIKRIAIVGESMGVPIAIDMFYDIVQDAARRGLDVANRNDLPWEIVEVIAMSSPFDENDPLRSEQLRWAAGIPYPGGMVSKFMVNMNWGVFLGLDCKPWEREDAFEEAWQKMLNETPPQLFKSMLDLMYDSDLNKQMLAMKGLFKNATFTYMQGELPDDTVDNDKAIPKYYQLFAMLIGTTWRVIVVLGAGHADSARSAQAMEYVYEVEAYTQEHRERSWEDANDVPPPPVPSHRPADAKAGPAC